MSVPAMDSIVASGESNLTHAKHFYANFIYFCILYSTAHATVDAVLAFSSAELGPQIGAIGGFVLYIFYTTSSLLAAKPALRMLGSKNGVLLGLISLLVYVTTFLLAVIFSDHAMPLFITGCLIGGSGAGILWTSHGSYYASNVDHYAHTSGTDKAKATNNFAAIFATSYLFMEAGFKLLATLIFTTASSRDDDSASRWKVIVFGIYTAAALCAVLLFSCSVIAWSKAPDKDAISTRSASQHGLIVELAPVSGNSTEDETTIEADTDANTHMGGAKNPLANIVARNRVRRGHGDFHLLQEEDHSQHMGDERERSPPDAPAADVTFSARYSDVLAVFSLIMSNTKLQCLLPFQVCFGVHAALINTYINAVVVKNSIGEGYIGLLAGIAALTAVLIAAPCAHIANSHHWGKYAIMLLGTLCFAFSGAAVLCASNSILSQWVFIVPYFIVHGTARGIWENTNKSVIADYFPDPDVRETAYAAVYFCNGISAAMGFLLFGWFSRDSKAAIVVVVAIIAGIGYHRSAVLHAQSAT